MHLRVTLLTAAFLLAAGCLESEGMESREAPGGDAVNPPDDCTPGEDRGAGGNDDDASQGGGRDACELPESADEARGAGA